jgi:hypothetical protein
METQHPEGGESPFIVKDDASVAAVLSIDGDEDEDPGFANCPIDGCGEIILLTELGSHIEMHDIEIQDVDQSAVSTPEEYNMKSIAATFDTNLSHELRNLAHAGNVSSERQTNAKAAWKEILKMPEATAKSASLPKGKAKGPLRRLGVNISGIVALYNKLLILCRNSSSVLTPTRIKCHLGLLSFWSQTVR